MLNPIRLLSVLPSLGGGGAERATIDLVRGMDRGRFQITLAVFSQNGGFLPQVPTDVQVVNLRGAKQYDIRLVLRLASLLQRTRPEIVFGVLRYANLVTLLAHGIARSHAPVVVNEQNLPSAEFALFGGRRIKSSLLKRLYPRASLVTAISHGIARELTTRYGLPARQVMVIPNPVDCDRVSSLATAKLDHPWFRPGGAVVVAAGRLHPQKGFGHLIRAFALVRSTLPCKLVILGEGPQRAELEWLIADLGLSTDVALPGFQDNPYKFMGRATLFVLSSLYEGFGNVLVEALALGTPVVASACPVGPDEIISHGVTGLLVPPADEQALAEAMTKVLNDSELRRKLSANGPARAADFSLQHIVTQYAALFDRLSSGA